MKNRSSSHKEQFDMSRYYQPLFCAHNIYHQPSFHLSKTTCQCPVTVPALIILNLIYSQFNFMSHILTLPYNREMFKYGRIPWRVAGFTSTQQRDVQIWQDPMEGGWIHLNPTERCSNMAGSHGGWPDSPQPNREMFKYGRIHLNPTERCSNMEGSHGRWPDSPQPNREMFKYGRIPWRVAGFTSTQQRDVQIWQDPMEGGRIHLNPTAIHLNQRGTSSLLKPTLTLSSSTFLLHVLSSLLFFL